MRHRSATLALLAGFALCLGWPQAGVSATLPEPGQQANGALELLGKHIPLPPGQWRVAAAGFGQVVPEQPGPYGAIGGVLLTRDVDESSSEFLLIHTNVLPVREGWGAPGECGSPDALFQNSSEARNLHQACSFVIASRASSILRSGLPAVADEKDAAAQLPDWALVAGLRVSDRRDVLDIRYGSMPKQVRPEGWFVGKDAMDGLHRRLIQQLGNWTLQARETALAALRDPADQVTPLPALPIDGNPAIKPQAPEISALRLALYKLATYRIPATTVSITMGTLLTGSLYTGAWLSFWQGFSHSAVYFGNELAWEWPRSAPEMRFIGVPGNRPMAEAAPLPAASRTLLAANSNVALPHRGSEAANASDTSALGVFAIDGKLVPLPVGTWTILAREKDSRATGVVLGRVESHSLTGLVIMHANPAKATAIFGSSDQCGRSDIDFAVVRYDTPEDGYCTYGKLVVPDRNPSGNGLWQTALVRLTSMGVSLPDAFMMVGARARTRENFVDARYYFLPDPAMMHRDREDTGLTPDPVEALMTWADLLQEPLEAGLRGRRPLGNPELPWPWQTNAVKDALLWQVRGEMDELAGAGVLGGTELLNQLAQANRALTEREHQRWSLWERSLYKVGTYRIASYVDAVTVSWLVLGNVQQSVGYATLNSMIYPTIAYLNEIAWARSGIGKAPASLLPAGFPEIGRDSATRR